MKNFILNFKSGIRFFTSIIISREFAVIYCLLGTISQISHTYFLIESISSLSGGWRAVQATMLSVFISSSLFYFVAIADKEDAPEEYKRVMLAINLFTFMEIIINIYYYTRHLLIDQKEYQILDYVFAIMVSCLIPVTIKLYSSSIRAKEWIIAIEHDQKALVDNAELKHEQEQTEFNFDDEKLNELIKPLFEQFKNELLSLPSDNPNEELINNLIETKLHNLETTIDKQISDSFGRNQELFLKQFENKLKLLSNEYLNKAKE